MVAFDRSPFKLFSLRFSKKSVQALSCERPKTAQQSLFLSFEINYHTAPGKIHGSREKITRLPGKNSLILSSFLVHLKVKIFFFTEKLEEYD